MGSSIDGDRWTAGQPQSDDRGNKPVRSLSEDIDSWLDENGERLIATRRRLHSNPELSWAEFETTAYVAGQLTAAGLEPRILPGNTGLFCDVGSGPTAVALRADLDALPIQDQKDVEYRSTVENVCHACGHDVHTTVIVGAALLLTHLRDRGHFQGRVRCIFQPSEERTPSGALDVISSGGLDDVSAIFGFHCAPQLPLGVVAVRSGAVTAAADNVKVVLRHPDADPQRLDMTSVDVIHAAGALITEAPAMLSRLVDTRSGAALTFGALNSRSDPQRDSDQVVVKGTVRVLDGAAWAQMPTLVVKMVEDIVAPFGVDATVEYDRAVPPVINDFAASTLVVAAARQALVAADDVIEAEISMGGEDFAYYLQRVSGAMLRLGVAPPDLLKRHDIHQPLFDVDERSIALGVRLMAHVALTAMSDPTIGHG